MKKKSFVVITIFLSLVIIGLCVFIAYDKNVFNIRGEKNTISEQNDEKNAGLVVGDIGEKNKEVMLRSETDKKISIENKKLVYKGSNGKKIIDSTIPEEVIAISLAGSCDGDDNRVLALTKNGNIYYNKKEYVSFDEEYEFDFIKVATDEKVYGIEAIRPTSPSTCGEKFFFAYTDEKVKKIVQIERNGAMIKSVSLGDTYDQLYPY